MECIVKSQRLLIACLYQPPRDLHKFLQKFESLCTVCSKRTNVIIIGDLNIDLIEDNASSYHIRKKFVSLLQKHNLYNAINEPTRITENSRTQIDHIIVPGSCISKVKSAHSIDLGISDHHLIYCSFNLFPKRHKPIFKTTKNYKDIDIEKLKSDFTSVPWQVCDIFNDVDDAVFVWEKLYKEVIEEHVKSRKVKVRAKTHPWMNGAIRKQLNNRYNLLKKAQTTPKGSNEWAAYKLLRNKCTKLIRVAEASYWKSKFQGVSSSSKEFWRCMNEFTGVHKVSTIGPLEDENGNIINSTKEKCDRMNNYFANVGKLRKNPENSKLLQHIYRVYHKLPSRQTTEMLQTSL